jgi:transposase-like protein
VIHFGPKIAADLRKHRPKPHTTWHLDEIYLKIDGRMVYLWRAVGFDELAGRTTCRAYRASAASERGARSISFIGQKLA